MLKSDLVEDLSAFHEKDKRLFRLYLKSPYFRNGKKSDDSVRLLEYILDALDLSDEKKRNDRLDRHQAFKTLYNSQPFNEEHLSQVMHKALSHVRAFIQHLEANGVNSISEEIDTDYSSIVEFFLDRGDIKVAKRYVRRLERQMSRDSFIGLQKDKRKFEAEKVLSRFYITVGAPPHQAHLREALEALDSQYFSQRAEILLSLLSFCRQRSGSLDEQAEGQLRSFFAQRDVPWFSSVGGLMYCAAIETLAGYTPAEQESAFERLLQLYHEHKARLGTYERDRFETIIINFCIQKFKEPKYREYLLDLYQRQYRPLRRSYSRNIHANNFITLLRLGIYCGDLEFVRALTEQCRRSVYGKDPSEIYDRFALANIAFEERRFRDALYLSRQIAFSEPQQQYLVRILGIKAAFELGEEYILDAQLHALRVALDRKEGLPPAKLSALKAFLRYVKALLHLQRKKRRAPDIEKLLSGLEQNPATVEARWLKSKIAQLQSNPKKSH